MLSGGEYGIIESIEKEELSTPEETYNFEVAEYHTYYVGDNGVLVHNKCGHGGKQKRLAELSNDEKISKTIRNELKQNKIKYGKYKVPKGYELSHKLGFEAYKGYDYSFSNLQLKSLHKTETRLQHKMNWFKK